MGPRGGRNVQRGIAVEEPDRLELEPRVVDGHHGPVLGTREVREPEGVPHDDVLAVYVAVPAVNAGNPVPPGCWLTN